ncbi:MAG: prevent-host-death family protein [Muribaculaceae bacterium]|nr:prevent-host-death family protein [Muribaculaceae bacterium]MDE7142060.1 prevent-host-death family protein [Muribaculaceae bacterium]
MEVVSAREFRSNQGKFLTAARSGQSVLLTSRYGNFKIIPVSETDDIIERDIRASFAEVKAHLAGKTDLPLAKDVVF